MCYVQALEHLNSNMNMIMFADEFWICMHAFKVDHILRSAAAAQSPQWYAWGPPNMQCRLCASCWIYWKKYGGLKTPTQLEGATRAGSVYLVYQYSCHFVLLIQYRTFT